MPGTAGPNLGLYFGYSPHDDGWGVESYNPAFAMLDGITFLSIISASLTAPPGSPVSGDRYIVGASPTGAWSGHAKDLAIWRDSAWRFYTPKLGWLSWSVEITDYIRYDGSAWVVSEALGPKLDSTFGSTQGSALMRGSSVWAAVVPARSSVGMALLSTGAFDYAAGKSYHSKVKHIATAALAACTYANGSAGVGATLTGNSNGALATLDGVAPVAGYRLIVAGQATQLQNGVYTITQVGDVSHPFILTRALDADIGDGNTSPFNVQNGDLFLVQSGTANAQSVWLLAGPNPLVVGTDSITFSLFASAIAAAGGKYVKVTSPAANDILVYNATDGQFENQRSHYDVAFNISGVPAASQSMEHQFSKAVTIPANFGAYLGRASQGSGTVNATASTVYAVNKSVAATPTAFTTSVGTITFAAGTVTPTFASTGGTSISFAQGDSIQLVAPASPDATFAGLRTTLCGFET